jgi:hypothetical protein
MLTGEDTKEAREKANELFEECHLWRTTPEPTKNHEENKDKLRLKMAGFLNVNRNRIAGGR